MIAFITVLLTYTFLRLVEHWYRTRRTIQQLTDELWVEKSLSQASERTSKEIWGFLRQANRRRKRFERALKKERAAGMKLALELSRELGDALFENRQFKEENAKLTRFHRSLAADVVGEILDQQDSDVVKKGLTRKVKKR